MLVYPKEWVVRFHIDRLCVAKIGSMDFILSLWMVAAVAVCPPSTATPTDREGEEENPENPEAESIKKRKEKKFAH